MTEIRSERPEDIPAIRTVNEEAFGQAEEADIVDRLRGTCDGLLSLAAVADERVVGHILFSPVTLDGPSGVVEGMGLAPMGVLPEHQRQGIGSKLAQAGLAALRESGCPFVIVLGHTEYCPRFGFEPASRHGIRCQWDGVPDEAFMILVLDETAMDGVSGVAKYRNEFDDAM